MWILDTTGHVVALDMNYVGKVEHGVIWWPNIVYRRAFRAVLGVESDADLGFRASPWIGSRPHSPSVTSSRMLR